MKARDVRERLQRKVDPDVLYVLEALAERQSYLHVQLTEVAAAINQMSDIIANVVQHSEDTNLKFEALGIKEVEPDEPVTQ